MEYFGTSLTEAGHYRRNLDNWYKTSLRVDDLPFHPEHLTNNLKRGEVIFYQGGGYTVIGISGAPADDRPGCKSIFWVKEIITKEEMIERIKSNELAMRLINALPFDVNYPNLQSRIDNKK